MSATFCGQTSEKAATAFLRSRRRHAILVVIFFVHGISEKMEYPRFDIPLGRQQPDAFGVSAAGLAA